MIGLPSDSVRAGKQQHDYGARVYSSGATARAAGGSPPEWVEADVVSEGQMET